MVFNQLFTKKPDTEIVNELVKIYGFSNLEDTNHKFSKKDLEQINILVKLLQLKDRLGEYYIPCKRRVYMNDITISKSITILRQFLKTVEYTLLSQEKYISGKKMIVYSIISIIEKKNMKEEKERKKNRYIVTFD